jgi:hypothetical protein
MLGIYFGNLARPQLHILNPWSLTGSTQHLDVYDLVALSSKPLARQILYVDVAGELNKIFKKDYNLQEKERVGFCTLWVGILAAAVIPHLPDLQAALTRPAAAASGVLSMEAAAIYKDSVYQPLQEQLDALIDATEKEFPNLQCRYLASAKAVGDLAATAQGAGKRKRNRRTYRKKSTWRQRRGRRSTRRA